MIDKTK
jgi:hypothetical protein